MRTPRKPTMSTEQMRKELVNGIDDACPKWISVEVRSAVVDAIMSIFEGEGYRVLNARVNRRVYYSKDAPRSVEVAVEVDIESPLPFPYPGEETRALDGIVTYTASGKKAVVDLTVADPQGDYFGGEDAIANPISHKRFEMDFWNDAGNVRTEENMEVLWSRYQRFVTGEPYFRRTITLRSAH